MTGINTQTFSAGQGAHGQGEQYTVLKSGVYEIAATGGQGGGIGTNSGGGGKGTAIDGRVHLDANMGLLNIYVGNAGSNVDTTSKIGGGGGGGASYVFYYGSTTYEAHTPILLAAAAGGGGVSKTLTGTYLGQGAGTLVPVGTATTPGIFSADEMTQAAGGCGSNLLHAGSTPPGTLSTGGKGGSGLFQEALSFGALEGGFNDFSQGGYGGGGSGEFVVGYGGGGGGYVGGLGGNSDNPYAQGGQSYMIQNATNVTVNAASNIGGGSVTISLIREDLTPTVANLAMPAQIKAYDTGATETAGTVARLYDTALNRTHDQAGAGYWINSLDKGSSLKTVASAFLNSAEYSNLYGSSQTNQQFVNTLYKNALDRNPDASGEAFWVNQLNSGHLTRAEVLLAISESPEAVPHNAQLVANGVVYQQWIS